MRKSVLIILLSILIVPAVVSANSIDLTAEPITNTVGPNQPATFNVTVTNNFDEDQRVRLKLPAGDTLRWAITPTRISVPANGQDSVTLNARQRVFNRGVFGFSLIASTAESQDSEQVRVIVSPETVEGFPLSVALGVDKPSSIDPRNALNFIVDVRNRNPRNIQDLNIQMRSPFFSENYTIDIDPNGQNSREFRYDLADDTSPGTYKVNLRAINPDTDEVVVTKRSNLVIEQYSTVNTDKSGSWNFFKNTYEVEFHNDGNIDRSYTYEEDMGFFQRLFLDSPDTYEVDGNVKWTVDLGPQESKTISYTTNYRLLVLILLFILLTIGGYYKFRTPLVMVKGAIVHEREGEKNRMKVRIFVRNRSNQPLYDIRVKDTSPQITEFKKPQEVGSLKPSKIRRSNERATKIFWDIDKLEPQEERILSYEAESKLPIVGNISLEPARAKFEEQSGRERTTISKKKELN